MTNLTDLTQEMYRSGPLGTTDKAQIIYKTATGLDYCRETAPIEVRTHDGAAAWARAYFRNAADAHARKVVTGFRVEWW